MSRANRAISSHREATSRGSVDREARDSEARAQLAEIKLMIEVLKSELKKLEETLGVVMPANKIRYTDDDYRELIEMRKRG